MEKLPVLAYDLVLALDQQYPNADPQIKDSDREVWMRVGKRHLVLHLKSLIDGYESEGLPNVIPDY